MGVGVGIVQQINVPPISYYSMKRNNLKIFFFFCFLFAKIQYQKLCFRKRKKKLVKKTSERFCYGIF